MNKKLYYVFAGLIIAAMLMTACGPAAEEAPDCCNGRRFLRWPGHRCRQSGR